jgi:hypothetical protein
MAKKQPSPKKPARTQARATNVSLYPLDPDRALAALLRVKPADVKRLEAAEAKKKRGKR